jgi:uncharacterized membrane protein
MGAVVSADPLYAAGGAPVPPARSAPAALLGLSAVVSVLALGTALLGDQTLSLVAYAVALLVATGLLAWYRWSDGQASKDRNYVGSPIARRAAVLVAVLIVLACAANAFVWATEVSKL